MLARVHCELSRAHWGQVARGTQPGQENDFGGGPERGRRLTIEWVDHQPR
jgi:hypothetical protein